MPDLIVPPVEPTEAIEHAALPTLTVLNHSREVAPTGEETFAAISKKRGSSTAKGKVYIETYGCQMNFSDTEIVSSVMLADGFSTTDTLQDADIIFLNTCAIRENAETKIHFRLQEIRGMKKRKPKLVVGVLGCMAERMKQQLFEDEKVIDLIAGPDAYRSLPSLVGLAESGQKAANVFLSLEETYADITPVRREGVGAFVSIMRGCDNMCSFCVVPFTRGRERSRPVQSILAEVKMLSGEGFKEITLLGQNVNSYFDEHEKCTFAELMDRVGGVDKKMRVRFTTSHPKDISEELVQVMAERDNLCKFIHLPAQSGSSRVLDIMSRNYTRESYLDKIKMIRSAMPDAALSTDIITGFPTETEDEHQETLSLLREVRFEYAFTFMYSERPNTPAAKHFTDDVPLEVKQRRLNEIIELQRNITAEIYKESIGQRFEVLVEGESKRSSEMWMGRADNNRAIIFPHTDEAAGDMITVEIDRVTTATMFGKRVE